MLLAAVLSDLKYPVLALYISSFCLYTSAIIEQNCSRSSLASVIGTIAPVFGML
jgi:hypothetical protein